MTVRDDAKARHSSSGMTPRLGKATKNRTARYMLLCISTAVAEYVQCWRNITPLFRGSDGVFGRACAHRAGYHAAIIWLVSGVLWTGKGYRAERAEKSRRWFRACFQLSVGVGKGAVFLVGCGVGPMKGYELPIAPSIAPYRAMRRFLDLSRRRTWGAQATPQVVRAIVQGPGQAQL